VLNIIFVSSGTKPNHRIEAVLPDNLAFPVQSKPGTDDRDVIGNKNLVSKANPRSGVGYIYADTFRATIRRPNQSARGPGLFARCLPLAFAWRYGV
jgi:hypothetical protein